MTVQKKLCRVCRKEKPRPVFHRDDTCKDGKRPDCKACRKKKDRMYRSKRTERGKLRVDKWIGERNCYICDQMATLGDHFDPRTKDHKFDGLSSISNEKDFQREAAKCLPACRLCNSTKGNYDKLVLAGEAEPDIEAIRKYVFEKVGEGQQY